MIDSKLILAVVTVIVVVVIVVIIVIVVVVVVVVSFLSPIMEWISPPFHFVLFLHNVFLFISIKL